MDSTTYKEMEPSPHSGNCPLVGTGVRKRTQSLERGMSVEEADWRATIVQSAPRT